MTDFIIIAVIACIVGAIIFYLVKSKKKGQKCIGCPYCNQCGGNCESKKK